jgi:murein L,D-transpeptidase YafK
MKTLLLYFCLLLLNLFPIANGFLDEQLKFKRVRNAYDEKIAGIEAMLKEKNLSASDFKIVIVAYKDEEVLEIYAGKKNSAKLELLKTYEICASSGELGPKRMQGDGQVPEGFYHINNFNPASNYHLSLGISYPNASDKIKTSAKDPGGSIYIHGSCVTIGCLPMTDDKIKEIYILAALAKNNGQNQIPVYIFPFRMDEKNFAEYSMKYASDIDLLKFWSNIKEGYDKFMVEKSVLNYTIDKKGNYCF